MGMRYTCYVLHTSMCQHAVKHRKLIAIIFFLLLLSSFVVDVKKFVLSTLPGFAASLIPVIREEDIVADLVTKVYNDTGSNTTRLPLCPVAPTWARELQQQQVGVQSSRVERLQQGGCWEPSDVCTPVHHVAIIVPYRDRPQQLATFLAYMHPFLQRQLIHYGIYVVEQSHATPFNRAKLFNIGYVESASADGRYHCFIFHDVDLLPECDLNMYACSTQPRHMSSSINVFRYNLPYIDLFGGVSAMLKSQFESVNGFSNRYYGWGGEDDDMYTRLVNHSHTITRWPPRVARYRMMRHRKQQRNEDRYTLLDSGADPAADGISTLNYTKIESRKYRDYTWIHVHA